MTREDLRIDGVAPIERWRRIGTPSWVTPGCHAIDVWRTELGTAPSGSPESIRARRSRTASVLRVVLASYLKCEPTDIRYARGPFGKPRLESSIDRSASLHFNVSRSGDRCVIAVSKFGPVGIDVERLAPMDDLDRVSARFLASSEARSILRLRGWRRVVAFYRCWTRKEAYVKADGRGLTIPFDGFTVSVHRRPRILSLEDDDPSTWRLHSLKPWPGYVCTLATRRPTPGLDSQGPPLGTVRRG
jgi:4'-phosphopantetheinyl transferase